MRQLTQAQRNEIVRLRETNARVSDISRRAGVARHTVYKWIKRYESMGTTERIRRDQHMRATTRAQDALIVKAHSRNPFRPTSVTAREYAISTETVRRRLHMAGLHHCLSASKTMHKEDIGLSTPENRSRTAETDDSATENELNEEFPCDDSCDDDRYQTSSPKHTDGASSNNSLLENESVQRLRYDDSSGDEGCQSFSTKQTDNESDEGNHCTSCNSQIGGFRYICLQCTAVDICTSCEAAGLHGLHYVLRVPEGKSKAEISSILEKIREQLNISHSNECETSVESEKMPVEEQPDVVAVVEESDPLSVADGLELPVEEEPDLLMAVEEEAVTKASGASQVTTNVRIPTDIEEFSDLECQSSDTDLFAHSKFPQQNTENLNFVPGVKNTKVGFDISKIIAHTHEPTELGHMTKERATIDAKLRHDRESDTAHSTRPAVTAVHSTGRATATMQNSRSILRSALSAKTITGAINSPRLAAGAVRCTVPAVGPVNSKRLIESTTPGSGTIADATNGTRIAATAAHSTDITGEVVNGMKLAAGGIHGTVPVTSTLNSTWPTMGATPSTGTINGAISSTNPAAVVVRHTVRTEGTRTIGGTSLSVGAASSNRTIKDAVTSTRPAAGSMITTWVVVSSAPSAGTITGTVNSTRPAASRSLLKCNNLPVEGAVQSTRPTPPPPPPQPPNLGPQPCASLPQFAVIPGTYFLVSGPLAV